MLINSTIQALNLQSIYIAISFYITLMVLYLRFGSLKLLLH